MENNFDNKLQDASVAMDDDFEFWLVDNKDEIEQENFKKKKIMMEAENKEFDRINRLRLSLGALVRRR